MRIIRIIAIAAVVAASATPAVFAEDTAQAPKAAEARKKLPEAEALDLSRAASQMQTADPTGWVGIRVAPLPEALATQLGLGENVGVLVLNVIRKGPAEQAGLQRYDVLLKRDGKLIAADAAAFIADVVGRKPGSTLTLRIVRQSKQKTIPVIVGKPRTFDEVRYKYAPLKPTQQRQREVGGIQAQVLRRVDNGWVVENDPNRFNQALSNLSRQTFEANTVPAPDRASVEKNAESERRVPAEAITWNDSRDVRVTVARTEDGLVVTRMPANPDANAQVDRYASEVEFRNNDRATYRYYNEYANQQRAASRVLDTQLALAETHDRQSGAAAAKGEKLVKAPASPAPRPRTEGVDRPADATAGLKDSAGQGVAGPVTGRPAPAEIPKKFRAHDERDMQTSGTPDETVRGTPAPGSDSTPARTELADRKRKDTGRSGEEAEVTCRTLSGEEFLAFARKLSAEGASEVMVISNGKRSTLLVGKGLLHSLELATATNEEKETGRKDGDGGSDDAIEPSVKSRSQQTGKVSGGDLPGDGKERGRTGGLSDVAKQDAQLPAVTSADVLAELRAIHQAVAAAARPAIEYVVTQDGKITVTVRGEDSTVKMEYAGRADLAKRSPELLKRFDKAMKNTQAAQ